MNSDGTFKYEVKQDTTKSMYSGQYFVVVQHPMMNGKYDIDWSGAPAEYVYDYGLGESTGAGTSVSSRSTDPAACRDPMQLKHLYRVSTSRTLTIPTPSSSS